MRVERSFIIMDLIIVHKTFIPGGGFFRGLVEPGSGHSRVRILNRYTADNPPQTVSDLFFLCQIGGIIIFLFRVWSAIHRFTLLM